VEDDLLIAQDLHEILEEVGYRDIFKARNYDQAIDLLRTQAVDLILLDIHLNNSLSGIQLADHINQQQLPFIYITSYSDADTLARVKPTRPAGFLLKPYSKDLLLATIEISLFNYSAQLNAADSPLEQTVDATDDNDYVINNHLLIKDNYRFVKIPFNEVLWVESDRNYLDIKTLERKYTIRCSLKKMAEQLPAADFVKCYKQFIINIRHAESFSNSTVTIKGHEIPISRSMQDEVLAKLKQ
jgi:DNA-binding LytR/AlgR family response regulator